jgi:UDP-3-O-[3-hydroxymyristoyl] glucosamine N-acyltransferase
MALTLRQVASLVQGQLHGDGDTLIQGAAIIRDAQPGEITLAEGDKALKQLAACQASAVLTGKLPAPPAIPYIQVENLSAAFAKLVEHFRPRRVKARGGVNSAAIVSPTAVIGRDVEIQAGAIIGDDVVIENGATIHSGVVVQAGCRIGADTTIFPNAVLYEDCLIGAHCIIHANAVIGAYGFGYSVVGGRHELSAQLGYVELGPRVEVGAGSTIDRGTYGPTTIGEGTKIDNLVMIAHNCKIGKHNLICSQVGVAGSATTGDYVVLAGQAGVRDHVKIGDRTQIGAKSGAMNDVPPDSTYVGLPAGPEKEYFQCLYGFAKLPELRKEFRKLVRTVEELERRLGGDENRKEAA